MVHQDTVELLRECDAGIQMGVSSIADVLPHVQNDALRMLLEKCQAEHEKLAREISKALGRFQDIAKRLIHLEAQLSADIRSYL